MAINDNDNSAIAHLLNCTPARVSNLRCAATFPMDKELDRLCEYYKVPLEFLKGEVPFSITQKVGENGEDSITWECE